jgi:hypothetical protein
MFVCVCLSVYVCVCVFECVCLCVYACVLYSSIPHAYITMAYMRKGLAHLVQRLNLLVGDATQNKVE